MIMFGGSAAKAEPFTVIKKTFVAPLLAPTVQQLPVFDAVLRAITDRDDAVATKRLSR